MNKNDTIQSLRDELLQSQLAHKAAVETLVTEHSKLRAALVEIYEAGDKAPSLYRRRLKSCTILAARALGLPGY
jgi:hypothetical protein